MNLLRARNFGIATIIAAILLIAGSVSFGETPTISVQVLPYSNYGTITPNYNGQTLTNSKPYSMTAHAKSGFTFVGWTGDLTSSKPKLTFAATNGLTLEANFVDKQKPTLSIQTPPNSTALTNPAIFVTGLAKDNDTLATVYYQLINKSSAYSTNWLPAETGNNWNNWWVNVPALAPNTNVLLAYAVDRSGNCSKTNQLKMTYSAAPTTLSGMALTVTTTNILQTNADNEVFVFGSSTFSEETGVGAYTYKKTGPVTGKLTLKYTAPPTGTANDTATLQFTSTNTGTFTDRDGTNYSFSLATETNLALPAVTGANMSLTDATGTNETLLTFLNPPGIVDNGQPFKIANPLVISLSAAYPGDISNRVSVSFTHLVYQAQFGSWVQVAPSTFAGTVIDIGANTNTVTILFDFTRLVSKTDSYVPMIGNFLNILTYSYTNTLGMDGIGTYQYTNYSPSGSLLQLTEANQTNFYILTYTNTASTNTAGFDSGNFYVETYGADGSFQGTNSGSFSIEAPAAIVSQPSSQTVTNGGTANFQVTATGSQPLIYQWQFNGIDLTDGNFGGSTISNSYTPQLTIKNVNTNNIGQYSVIVANSFGSVTSSIAPLNMTLAPAVTSQPLSVALNTNQNSASFSVTANGYQPLYYQWYSGTNQLENDSYFTNGSDYAQSVITLANLQIQQISSTNFSGNFQVIITNIFGSVTSSVATLKYSSASGINPGGG